jgi:hypothetical protein
MYTVCTPTELNRKTLIFTPNKPPSSTFLQLTHTQSHMPINGGDCLRRPAIAFFYRKGRERKETKRTEKEVRERAKREERRGGAIGIKKRKEEKKERERG